MLNPLVDWPREVKTNDEKCVTSFDGETCTDVVFLVSLLTCGKGRWPIATIHSFSRGFPWAKATLIGHSQKNLPPDFGLHLPMSHLKALTHLSSLPI